MLNGYDPKEVERIMYLMKYLELSQQENNKSGEAVHSEKRQPESASNASAQSKPKPIEVKSTESDMQESINQIFKMIEKMERQMQSLVIPAPSITQPTPKGVEDIINNLL